MFLSTNYDVEMKLGGDRILHVFNRDSGAWKTDTHDTSRFIGELAVEKVRALPVGKAWWSIG